MAKPEVRLKFTKTEKSWILYDWANSVYATNMLAAIFPIYFASVCTSAGVDNVVQWSYGTSIATLTVAVLAPILGAVGDYKGMKKKLFCLFALLGIGFTAFNAFTTNWQSMLVGYVFSYIGFTGSGLFYDSFLTDVTKPERMDKVSSWGYAMGYIGGSTIPFILSIVILLVMGMTNPLAMKIVILLTSAWWAIFSIPMLLNVKQVHYVETPPQKLVQNTFKGIVRTLKSIFKNKGLFQFMLAYFFYIDGVNTVISQATSYGSSLGLDSIGMILALVITQVVAVPCSILFGKLANRFGSIRLITGAVLMYFVICILGFFMGYNIEQNPGSAEALATSQGMFWGLCFLVGTVQGGIQALSRSYFGKLVPPSRSNEYFGFFDIFGKFAAVVGPWMVGTFKAFTGRDSIGILSLILLFLVGAVLLLTGKKKFQASESIVLAEEAAPQN